MLASAYGHTEIVKELLKVCGGTREHVLAQTKNGITALMEASQRGHIIAVVKALLDFDDSV